MFFSLKLRELRKTVARLLVINHLPLDLQQVDYDCEVIDEILSEVVEEKEAASTRWSGQLNLLKQPANVSFGCLMEHYVIYVKYTYINLHKAWAKLLFSMWLGTK